MRRRGLIWSVLAVLLAAGFSFAGPPEDEVLVLGLRLEGGKLATCLVDASGIRKVGDGLAVPRAEGWWKLVLLDRQKNQTSEKVVYAAPAKNPVPPPPLEDNGCEAQSEQVVLFVGSDFVAVERSDGGYCEGAAHPYAYVGLQTLALSKEAKPKDAPIDAVLGKEALASFEKSAKAAHGGSEKREADCLGDARPDNFGLIRMEGRWVVRGGLAYLAEVCRGKYEYFTVPFEPPAKVTGQTNLAKDFKELAKAKPGLLDAVSSPGGKLLLLVTPLGLELQADGKAAGKLELSGAAIVMTQWAMGKNAARWREEVPKVLAGGP